MGIDANRRERMAEDLAALDDAMEHESTGVKLRFPSAGPVSHVRADWRTPDEASDSDTWDETTHTTWGDACDAPLPLPDDDGESDAARLVALATRTSVGEAMASVFVVGPNARLDDLAMRLRSEDVIVADRHGVPLGIVQRGEHGRAARAGEVMEPIGTLEQTDRLSKALGLMAAEGIAVMCVVAADQAVVGLIYAHRALAQLLCAAQRVRLPGADF